MKRSNTSKVYLRRIIGGLKTHYDKQYPGRGTFGVRFITGGAPSENPDFCYARWCEASYPVLFEGTSRDDMEKAFELWRTEQLAEGTGAGSDSCCGSSSLSTDTEVDTHKSADCVAESEGGVSLSSEEHSAHEEVAVQDDTSSRNSSIIPRFLSVETVSSPPETDDADASTTVDALKRGADCDDDWRSCSRSSSLASPSPSTPSTDDYDYTVFVFVDYFQDLDAEYCGVEEQLDDASEQVNALPSSVFAQDGLSSIFARGTKRLHEEDMVADPITTGRPVKMTSAQKAEELELPYRCTVDGCNQRFSGKAELKRHLDASKAHATRAYECPACMRAFTRPYAFERHYLSKFVTPKLAACREGLRIKAGDTEWTPSTAQAVLQACEVPHVPKIAPQ